jgi:hypothetical protein
MTVTRRIQQHAGESDITPASSVDRNDPQVEPLDTKVGSGAPLPRQTSVSWPDDAYDFDAASQPAEDGARNSQRARIDASWDAGWQQNARLAGVSRTPEQVLKATEVN